MPEIVLNSASSDPRYFLGEALNYGTWTIKLNTFSIMWPSVTVTGQGSLEILWQNKTNTKTSTAKQKTNWNYHSGWPKNYLQCTGSKWHLWIYLLQQLQHQFTSTVHT